MALIKNMTHEPPVDIQIPAPRDGARLPFGALTTVLAASALLPMPQADGRILHLPSVCAFYNMTGLPCPACGLTRAFVCIAHGHFAESVHWHPLGMAVFAVAVLLWIDGGWTLLRGDRLFRPPPRLLKGAGWSFAAIFFLVGFTRMAYFAATHQAFGAP